MGEKFKRDSVYDIMKGILIILVVIGHVISLSYINLRDVWYNPIYNFIYTFHMPLFILLSGFFVNSSFKKTLGEVFVQKGKRLLLPAFLFSTLIIFCYLLVALCNTRVSIHVTKAFLYKQYVTYWYLICLFVLTCLLHCFYNKNIYVKILIVGLYVFFLCTYNYLPKYILKDCQIIRMSFIFSIATYMYRTNKLKHITDVSMYKRALYLLILSFFIFYTRYIYGINMMDYPIIIRIEDGFCCAFFVFIILFPIIRKYKDSALLKLFAYLGRNSLFIYLLHMVFIRIIRFNEIVIISSYSCIIPVSLCIVVVCVLFLTFFRQLSTKYKYMLGI